MNSVRKSLFRQIITRFSVLVFFLLIIISAVLLFFARDLLLQAGVPELKVLSSLFALSRFIFVFILVVLVISVLLGFIFIENFKSSLLILLDQIAGLKTAPFGTRTSVNSQNEIGDLSHQVNQVINKLEQEITGDLSRLAAEEMHFKDEQNLLGLEQKKIYEEKEKLEYVLSRVTDGIILLTRNRNVVLLNKAAEEIIGFNQVDAANRQIGWLIKFFEKDQELPMDEYAPTIATTAMQNNAFARKKLRLETRKIKPKFIDLICVKLALIHTQDLGYMIVLHDLTHEIEAEKKKVGLLSSFVSELKNPLNMISNVSQQPMNPQAGSQALQSGIAHLSLVMENLLTAGSIEEGTIAVAPVSVDLAEIINNSLRVVSPVALDRQISLSFSQPENFSPLVKGDQGRMTQVILNLLLNAVYFTPSGGNISVSLSSTESEIILQIQDTGIGIPTEAMKDLFTKFFVIPNDKGLINGIGLGLYICRQLVELQGGKIWLDSVEGRGTVVSISLSKVN